ncbi:MAG: CysS/YqeB C-terminal domain-containing protein [Acidimicrobiia bacterium]
MGEPDSNDAWALVEQRRRAREARDYRLADELRDRIAALGFEVLDTPDGTELIPAAAPPAEVSVLVDTEGWPEDAARFLASFDRHRGDSAVEVVPANQGPDLGFGAAKNRALARAGGNLVVLVDTSLEITGDLLGALAAALGDPTVAVAGPFGLVSADLRDYEERTAGDVVAVQGYCLAARRADLVAVGGVRESFAFYRNADIDLSLRLRTLHDPVRRAVAVAAEHCRRYSHRAWEATPEAERAELSRRNMRRVHKRFLGREDLTVP